MAGKSRDTTDLGPRLSADTTKYGAASDESRAKVDFNAAHTAFTRESSSATTVGEPDGLVMEGESALWVESDNTNSTATFTIRSGNTLFEFTSDNALTI